MLFALMEAAGAAVYPEDAVRHRVLIDVDGDASRTLRQSANDKYKATVKRPASL